MNILLRLKEWLTVSDAARHLTELCGESVSDADVLRLALDGHLKLSVHFVNHARGRVGDVVPIEKARLHLMTRDPLNTPHVSIRNIRDIDELPEDIRKDLTEGSRFLIPEGIVLNDKEVLELEDEVRTISGVWDLPMIGAERLDVEHAYQQIVGGPDVTLMNLEGAFVRGPDGRYCQLQESFDSPEMRKIRESVEQKADAARAKEGLEPLKRPRRYPPNHKGNFFPAGALPSDSVLVVRTSALIEFQRRLETGGDSESGEEAMGKSKVRSAKVARAANVGVTVASNLKPVVDVWPLVKEILGNRGIQAVDFVEESFKVL